MKTVELNVLEALGEILGDIGVEKVRFIENFHIDNDSKEITILVSCRQYSELNEKCASLISYPMENL